MVAGAIVVVGSLASGSETRHSSWGVVAAPTEVLAGQPICCLEVLGRSTLHRTLARLLQAGAQPIAVVADGALAPLVPRLAARFVESRPVPHSPDSWPAAERTFAEYVECGVRNILLIRLGAYVEVNFTELLRFHCDRGDAVTRAFDGRQPLDLWCIRAESARRAAGPGLRQLIAAASRPAGKSYPLRGYVNRLVNARDLRRLAVDGLFLRCAFRPGGREVRPGIWMEESAQVHRGARVVAPAYIGHKARIQAAALLTRGSNVECGSHVDYGTMVEDTSILAHTYLGAGLDVSHAVVSGNHLVNLRRGLAVEICDSKLIAAAPPAGAVVRLKELMYPRARHLVGRSAGLKRSKESRA